VSLYSPELGEQITALVGEQVGGMVTGLYGIIQYIDEDGEQRIVIAAAPGQTFVVTQGLLTIANAVADTELTTYVLDATDIGDDDDGA
jgi:hypothetical protein